MNSSEIEVYNHTYQFLLYSPSKLGILAAKIAYFNFEWRFVTLIMFSTIEAIGLHAFLQNYQKAVVIKLGRFIPEHRAAVPQLVIFGANSSEIISTVRWVVDSQYDSNAKYIIICSVPKQDCDEQSIFGALAKLYILNVVLLKTSHETYESLAFSYQIASEGKCNSSVPYGIKMFMGCKNDDCFKSLFPERLLNFHKCRFILSTIEQPPFMYLHNGTKKPSGIDGDIMKLAADMLNATLVLQTPSDDSDSGHYTNNNWTGSLGDVFNGRRQASACSSPLTATKYGNFQISFTYYSMDIVWATSLPKQTASWEKLLHPLNVDVRIVLLFTFIGIIFLNIFCKTITWSQIGKAFKIKVPKYSLLFYAWIIFLGMPILREPSRRSFLITVYSWIWACFIIRSCYQGALINFLKQPDYLTTYKTFEEVLNDGKPYGGIASLKEYYNEDRAIYNNWVVVDLDHLNDTLDEILDGTTDFVIASNKEVIKHYLMKYNGTKQLHIIPEKIVNSPTVVYFKKFSPLTSPLSYVLRVAFEAGFIHRTYEKYFDRDKKLLHRQQTHQPSPLRMEHFSGCFALLIVGWFISVTYFAVEYVCGNSDE